MAKRRVSFVDENLKTIFENVEFYKPSIKDKEFRERWKEERARRLEQQPGCLYCSRAFTNKNSAVLHHREMPSSKSQTIKHKKASLVLDVLHKRITIEEAKLSFVQFMNGLNEYYKTLQDTDLICVSCHARQHPGVVRSSKQKRL